MKQRLLNITSSTALRLISTTFSGELIDYPEGYRHWPHVKSMVIHKGHPLQTPFRGIHHVYANRKALEGSKSGEYEDGSEFVFDLLDYKTEDQASTEGPRKLLGTMVKERTLFTKTDGWGYEGWSGDSRSERLVKDGGARQLGSGLVSCLSYE